MPSLEGHALPSHHVTIDHRIDHRHPPHRSSSQWRRRTTVWRAMFTTLPCVVGWRRRRERVQDNDGMSVEHPTLTAWTRAAFAAIALLLSLAAPVGAGPLEDGTAAYEGGDYATAAFASACRPRRRQCAVKSRRHVLQGETDGVPQNYAEALKWYRLAADQGDATRKETRRHVRRGWACRRTMPKP